MTCAFINGRLLEIHNFKNFIDKKINVIYNDDNDKGVEGSSNGFVVFFILN